MKRKLLTPRNLPERDLIAMAGMLTDIHVAVAIVPGDKSAEAMVTLLRRYGIYRRSANAFTAREGGDPLTARGRRIFSLVPAPRP